MTKSSRFTVARNLSFPWKVVPGQHGESTLHDIIDNSNTGDVVSVKAKVVSKSESKDIYSPTMQKKSDVVIADSTGAINLTVWESMVDQLVCEQSC